MNKSYSVDNVIEQFYPSHRNPLTYIDAIREYNYLIHGYGGNVIQENFPQVHTNRDICLVTTGSDGRLEKSPFSPIEIIVLHNNSPKINTFKEELKDFISNHENLFDKNIEVKNLKTELSCTFENYSDRVFPTRALDSMYIAGNEYLQEEYQKNVVNELSGENGKKLLRRFDDKRRGHKRILVDETHKDRSFNLQEGLLFYDNNRLKSTKYAHLRSIQYKIAADLCKGIKKEELDYEFISNFSKKTIDRLNSLYYMGKLNMSPSQIDDVINAYRLSLYWYHLSEENFQRNGEMVTNIDIGELKDVTTITKNFIEYQSILK